MHGTPFFVQDAEHPQKITFRSDILVITDEAVEGRIRWSRFVQGNYYPERGFLTTHGDCRIALRLYMLDEGTRQYTPCYNEREIAEELNRLIPPDTLTAIHYVPGDRVDSLMIGLPLDTELLLPSQFKQSLPRYDENAR